MKAGSIYWCFLSRNKVRNFMCYEMWLKVLKKFRYIWKICRYLHQKVVQGLQNRQEEAGCLKFVNLHVKIWKRVV